MGKLTPLTFLQSITGYVAAQQKAPTGSVTTPTGSAAARAPRLATIDPAYSSATYPLVLPKVTFDGETSLTVKRYSVAGPYTPAPGDRVLLVPSGNTFVIIGAINTPGEGGGGGGSVLGAPPGWLLVAASNAPTAVRDVADYLCDGTADDVQIQAAIDAVQAVEGEGVMLSQGDFALTDDVRIEGDDNVDLERDIRLKGMGPANTRITAGAAATAGITVAKVARCHLSGFRVIVDGATHGIASEATHDEDAGWRSFWLSSFKDLQIIGPWDGSHTGFGMHLSAPFRSVFENIDMGGVGNGLRMFSEDAEFNPGDCTVIRMFIDLAGDNAVAYSIESLDEIGNMNQVEFLMCEAITSGTGGTGVFLGGTGPANHIKFRGVNLEQFDTAYHAQGGEGNHIDGNYWELRLGATANTTRVVKFGSAARNCWVKNIGMVYSEDTIRFIESESSDTDLPHLVEHVKFYSEGTVTNDIDTSGAVIRKWIVAEGAGTYGTVTVTPA